MTIYDFETYYYSDCYAYNIEDNRLDTIMYKGTSPTIVITHPLVDIRLYFYVSNKNGSITLKNIYDAIDAQADEYKKIYNTQKLRKFYIDDFIPINPITFLLSTYTDRPYTDSDEYDENDY